MHIYMEIRELPFDLAGQARRETELAGQKIVWNGYMTAEDYSNRKGVDFSTLFNVQLIIGVTLYIIGFLTWLYILSRMDLNTAYPVAVTLSFIAVILASALLLKEPLTVNIGIGTVFCLIGVFMILR